MTAERVRALTSDRVLIRNISVSLVAQGAPLLAALFAVPLLIQFGGTERFALLTIAWTFVGYFSLADAGLGRALTHFVSDRLGSGRDEEIPGVAWTGILLMALLGILGGVAVWWGIYPLLNRIAAIPPELQEETLRAFQILAVGLPFVVVAASFRGILEAVQNFGAVSAVRVPVGMLTFLGPVAMLPFTVGLDAAVGALIVARVLGCIAFAALTLYRLPVLRRPCFPEFGRMSSLLSFGGWVTVSNIVGPLMVHMDRLVIAGVISLSAVAYYATPFEVVTRLWIIPVGISTVIFPAFAAAFLSAPRRVGSIFEDALRAILIGILPLTMLFIVMAETGLALWVGQDFAQEGAAVVRWLAVAIYVNSFAHIPYILLQAGGRPDLTAKAHLIEAPFYFLLLWFLLGTFGIAGAAVAWFVRVLLDALLLFTFTGKIAPYCWPAIMRTGRRMVGGGVFLGIAALPVGSGLPSVILLTSLLMLYGVWGWKSILRPRHRLRIMKTLAPAKVESRRTRGGQRRRHRSVVVALPILIVVTLGTASSLSAQSQTDSGRSVLPLPDRLGSMEVEVNDELERYLREAQLLGIVPISSWSIRGFGEGEVEEMLRAVQPDEEEMGRTLPWESTDRENFTRRGGVLSLLPVETRLVYNTAFPSGGDEGPEWAGKGITGIVRFGIAAKWGAFTARLNPVAFRAGNGDFELMENGREGALAFVDARSPTTIDLPQRFGEDAYARISPGESYLRVDAYGAALGFSTAAQQWGPARSFPLLLGGNAGGFPHLFLGSTRPVGIGIGRLHGRFIWGKPAHSEYAPPPGVSPDRFTTGGAIAFLPYGLDGLEIGVSRFIHLPWRDGGPSVRDLLSPLIETDLYRAVVEGEAESGDIRASNHLFAGFFRWVLPSENFEMYGEIVREDAAWDLRDLLLEPDHDIAWVLGFAHVWGEEERPSGGLQRFRVLRVETMESRISHLAEVRSQTALYRHTQLMHGHTHRGQVLGSPAVYGGGGTVVGVDTFLPWGRWTVRWERTLRNARWTPPGGVEPGKEHDVTHSLGVDGVWLRGSMELQWEATGILNLNRYFKDDASNFRTALGAVYRF